MLYADEFRVASGSRMRSSRRTTTSRTAGHESKAVSKSRPGLSDHLHRRDADVRTCHPDESVAHLHS